MQWKSLAGLLCIALIGCGHPAPRADAGPDGGPDAGVTGIISTLASGQNDPVTMSLQGGSLYWASYTAPGGAILSIPTAGAASPTVVQPSRSNPYSVTTDTNNVYWLDYGTYDATSGDYNSDGAVLQSPLAGGSMPITLATAQDGPNAIAVAAGTVFWVDIGDPVAAANAYNYPAGLVLSAPIGGTTVTTLASTQNYPYAIAADSQHVYWGNAGTFDSITGIYNQDGTVVQANLDGTHVMTLASGQYFPTAIASDADNVYWANGGQFDSSGDQLANTGYIAKAPIGGTTVTTLAQYQDAPVGISVDSVHVCWVNGGAQNQDGSIALIPIGGGTPASIVSNLKNPVGVAISPDDGHVYWTEAGTNGSNGAVVSFTRQ